MNLSRRHNLKGKVAVLTGGMGELCSEIAKSLGECSVKLIVIDISEKALKTQSEELKDILEKWAKRTITSAIPPIRIGNTNKILKDRLSTIFFQDRSEWEEFLKKQGHLSDLDELAKTNFSYYLGKVHDVFLKPLGYEE